MDFVLSRQCASCTLDRSKHGQTCTTSSWIFRHAAFRPKRKVFFEPDFCSDHQRTQHKRRSTPEAAKIDITDRRPAHSALQDREQSNELYVSIWGSGLLSIILPLTPLQSVAYLVNAKAIYQTTKTPGCKSARPPLDSTFNC